jgi:hypothetical protein
MRISWHQLNASWPREKLMQIYASYFMVTQKKIFAKIYFFIRRFFIVVTPEFWHILIVHLHSCQI